MPESKEYSPPSPGSSSAINVGFGREPGEVSSSSHLAYFWTTEKEFADAVQFLEIGLAATDHCVIFGHEAANEAVCAVLRKRGYDVDALVVEGRVTILVGSAESAEILDKIGTAFQKSLLRGASLIRLLGNIGWGKSNWPDEKDLLVFEAKVTEAAKKFPCVVVCMYDVGGLPGPVLHHGGLGTHTHVICNGLPLSNPHHIPSEIFLRRVETIAGSVAERRRNEETLHHISEGTARYIGEEFFRQLTRHLAAALRVRYCFVTECTDDSRTRVRALAFWDGQGFAQNVEYPLHGTPCEKVIAGNICSYPERLQILFPEDQELVTLGAESYAGVPLLNPVGNILGHLVVMDEEPRVLAESELRILKIFASRAGIELERARADATLRLNQERLRTLLSINNAIVTKLTREEVFHAICAALSPVIQYDRIALSLYDPRTDDVRLVAYEGPLRTEYSPVGNIHDMKDSHVGWVFLNQRPLVRHDLETEAQFASEQRAYKSGFRSLCALPLVVRGRSIGAITVASLANRRYKDADGDFLMEVAKQIAIAIDNMTAHEEMAALKARFEAEAVYLQEEIKTVHNFEEIIGQSAPVREMLRKIEQVAPTDATVLISGETGTGKELVARAIHDRSRRNDRPLVKVNCGSIPAGLMESELFGHEKGAFTGATQRRIGRFELANGGTIFLDEVSELPLETQVKLLRVLQEGEFERVGSSQTLKVDVRVIAATNRHLNELVTAGGFRSDLYYRLNVFPLDTPPLRERKHDIPLLVNFFLSRFRKKLGKDLRGVSQKGMDSLVSYAWPGNIRELQNIVERSAVVAAGPIVHVDDSLLGAIGPLQGSTIETLESLERNHILRALADTHWVIHGKKGAAGILGINPSTLRSRMEKLGIKRQA